MHKNLTYYSRKKCQNYIYTYLRAVRTIIGDSLMDANGNKNDNEKILTGVHLVLGSQKKAQNFKKKR